MNMREVFEKWARSNDFAIQRMNANPEEYISSMTQFAWMGYAAAIEAVKAGGPDCYRGQEGVVDLAYDAVDPYYPLYKLPEDV